MIALNVSHWHGVDTDTRDLDSAFNDNYQSPQNSLGFALLRWALVMWVVATLTVGTWVIARATIQQAPHLLAELSQFIF